MKHFAEYIQKDDGTINITGKRSMKLISEIRKELSFLANKTMEEFERSEKIVPCIPNIDCIIETAKIIKRRLKSLSSNGIGSGDIYTFEIPF